MRFYLKISNALFTKKRKTKQIFFLQAITQRYISWTTKDMSVLLNCENTLLNIADLTLWGIPCVMSIGQIYFNANKPFLKKVENMG